MQKFSLPAISIFLLLSGRTVTAQVHVWQVPVEMPTIQEAIDASEEGDRILVSPGIYVGAIDFHGKGIVLQGVGGASQTTILGDVGANHTTVTIGGGSEVARIMGFSIRNDLFQSGNLALLSWGESEILNCIFTGEFANQGSGGGSGIELRGSNFIGASGFRVGQTPSG